MSLTTVILIAIFWYAGIRSAANKRAARQQQDDWLQAYIRHTRG